MCMFCKNLYAKFQTNDRIVYSNFYLKLNRNNNINYIKPNMITGKLIPWNVICNTRGQKMRNGIINGKWFAYTFKRPLSSVSYSLRMLNEIIK